MELGILFELEGKDGGVVAHFVALDQMGLQLVAARDKERIIEAKQGGIDRIILAGSWIDVVNILIATIKQNPTAGRRFIGYRGWLGLGCRRRCAWRAADYEQGNDAEQR